MSYRRGLLHTAEESQTPRPFDTAQQQTYHAPLPIGRAMSATESCTECDISLQATTASLRFGPPFCSCPAAHITTTGTGEALKSAGALRMDVRGLLRRSPAEREANKGTLQHGTIIFGRLCMQAFVTCIAASMLGDTAL
ncbi:unnamed protein product [Rangifer tarandus platyrhynchus]|uniref:Uncharacterized protein n=1 Tax=Rangifer tarandus platyrhynchus TaxID=3082113 RepID=A0ABN8XLI4_RANTA|nr:unnamed protein product [Rangifer tarandus platyrhynchus]